MADGNAPKRLVFTDPKRFFAYTKEGSDFGRRIQTAIEPIVEQMMEEDYDPSDIYAIALGTTEFIVSMTLHSKRWAPNTEKRENDNG